MILGIGVDLVEIERVITIYNRSPKFLSTFLTEKEITYFESINRPSRKYEWLAGRFSAKEAILKAFSSGLNIIVNFKDLEILNDKSGIPILTIKSDYMGNIRGNVGWNLTITHTSKTACAVLVLEQLEV